MSKLFMRYADIDHTLHKLCEQVNESIWYMKKKLPSEIQTPEELFYYLKDQLIFVDDPPDTELLQTSQTIFENNYHEISGAGDCDCFAITAIASLYCIAIPVMIILAGRSLRMPVHIYLRVLDGNRWKNFDLTEKEYNSERNYTHVFEYPLNFVYPKKNSQEADKLLFDTIRKKYFKNNLKNT